MKKGKNTLLLIILLLAGFLAGGLVAEATKGTAAAFWLSYGTSFGISPSNPLHLDFAFLQLVFGFEIKLNVAELIGMAGALLIYRRLA